MKIFYKQPFYFFSAFFFLYILDRQFLFLEMRNFMREKLVMKISQSAVKKWLI